MAVLRIALVLVAALTPWRIASGQADPFSTKSIRVVIAQLPGGTADTVLRMYGEKMGELGSEAVGSAPTEFQKLIVTEITRWRRLVARLGIGPG